MNRKLEIIYEDSDMLVCNKPAGIAVQSRRAGEVDLESMVRNLIIKRTGDPNSFSAPVHRLDQPVEGLVLFAKTKKAAVALSEQFRLHTVQKYYLAIVDGIFEEKEGMLVDWLKRADTGNRSRVVSPNDPDAKRSQLKYRVLVEEEGRQLLEIHLLTGRHHQIRVQMHHAGHPIIGDACYHPDYAKSYPKCYPALCAYRLEIERAFDKKHMHFLIQPSEPSFRRMAAGIRQF